MHVLLLVDSGADGLREQCLREQNKIATHEHGSVCAFGASLGVLEELSWFELRTQRIF